MSTSLTTSTKYVGSITKERVEVYLLHAAGTTYEVPMVREVVQAVRDSIAHKPVNSDSPFEDATGRQTRSVKVLNEHIPVTKDLCLAVLYRNVVLDSPYMRVGRMLDGVMQRAFADLRSNGCTVTYAERDKKWSETMYYSLRIEGPAIYVEEFEKWAKRGCR